MALLPPEILSQTAGAHGLSPYDIVVEYLPDQPASAFPGFTGLGWTKWPVMATQLTLGYGAGDNQSFTFRAWDPNSVEAEQIVIPAQVLHVPQNGDWICVTILDPSSMPNGRCMFRGMIRSVHEEIQDAGMQYVVTAVSDINRLANIYVSFLVNFRNNPINPTPRFDNAGNLLAISNLATVYQVVENIMNFRDCWASQEYFQFTDIVWNGLDTDPRCGAYVPPTVDLTGKSKGEAIQEILQSAGNFTFFYVPNRNGRGTIQIVEINLACNKCGVQWDINWPPDSEVEQTILPNYAFNYTMAQDNSAWDTEESVNVVRVTSNDFIRFYSGNWFIPELIDGDNNKNAVQIENDTVDMQLKRAVNLDFTNHRFTDLYDKMQDLRSPKIYPVGMPLFPDWNVHEDYLPSFVEIQDANVITSPPPMSTGDSPVSMTAENYRGLVEYESFTVGDQVAHLPPTVRYINNLRAYQAWFTRQSCPACTPSDWPYGAPGYGLVDQVYSGDNNEPNIEWYFIDGSGNRTAAGTTVPVPTGSRMTYVVTNYIFPPSAFGSVPPTPSGTTPPSPSGLIPWSGTTDYNGGSSQYPLPWKNLCPVCRGTGMLPEFKIRNIEDMLYEGRNNQITQTGPVTEVPVDPDFTQTGPESFDESNNRTLLREPYWIMVEAPLLTPQMPVFANRNQNWDTIKGLTSDEQHNQSPNPLSFVDNPKLIPTIMGIDSSDAEAQIVDPSWTVETMFTTIQYGVNAEVDKEMGRVIFSEPQFIPCRKKYTNYVTFDNGQFLISPDGTLTQQFAGNGQVFADRHWHPTGFWRHARVWMQFYYTRQLHYDYMQTDIDGNTIPITYLNALTPDGLSTQYMARTAIHDGRYVIEIRNVWAGADEVGGTQFPTGNMILQKCIVDPDSRIETSLMDLYKMPVPISTNNAQPVTPAALEAYKRGLGLDFPRARFYKFEATSPNEVMAEQAGYIAIDYANSTTRPRVYSWRPIDDRSRLIARGIRELELGSQLKVSGTLLLIGQTNDISRGLGYVNKPNQGLAAVQSVEYNFTDALQCELTISRDEARFGEIVPTQEEQMNDVTEQVTRQGRVVDAMRANRNIRVNQSTPTQNANDVSSGAGGLYIGGS